MDYNVVRTHVNNAFKYYKNDDKKFHKAMTDFYTVGKENPSVAGVIYEETINNGIQSMLNLSKKSADGIKPTLLPSGERVAENDVRIEVSKIALAKAINSLDLKDKTALKNIAAKEGYDKTFDELYPRTGKIRKTIIESGNIKTDSVSSKMSWGQKIQAMDSTGVYAKQYPKSHAARIALIINGQIKDGEVTKRVGFFKRASYKPFLKKAFSFAKTAK
ncbi:hypothetical protein J6O48_06275 [bacterium]|nr:hypothetical protein [bacterium]